MRIDREIAIDVAPERVWQALTDPKELSAWFQVSIEGGDRAGERFVDGIGLSGA